MYLALLLFQIEFENIKVNYSESVDVFVKGLIEEMLIKSRYQRISIN